MRLRCRSALPRPLTPTLRHGGCSISPPGRGSLFLLLLLVQAAWAGSWPGHRRQTDRTGWAVEDAVPPLTQKWTAGGSGLGIASPVVWGGLLVVARDDGTLTGYDRLTGGATWQAHLGARLLATPLVVSGMVCQPTTDGRLVALEAATGKIIWQIAYGGHNAGSPTLMPDGRTLAVAAGAPDRAMVGIDLVTRAIVWKASLTQDTQTSPAWDGTRLVGAANDGTAVALSTQGATLWSASGLGQVYFGVPAAYGGKVFVPSGNNTTARALAAGDGSLASTANSGWVDPTANGTVPMRTSSFALARGADGLNYAFVILKSADLRLYALDADNLATVRWSVSVTTNVGDSFLPSPAVANDVVYAVTPDWPSPALYAYTVSSGGVLGSWPLDAPALASPAVANGWVYVVTRPGTVYAFEAARALALTSPDTEQIVPPGQPVTLSAVVKGLAPTGYTVEAAPGRKLPDDGGFTVVATAGGSANPAALGTWSPSDLGEYTVRLTATDQTAGPRRSLAYFRVGRAPVIKFLRAAEGGEVVLTSRIKIVFPPYSLSRDGAVTAMLLDETILGGTLGAASPVRDTALEVTLEPGLTLKSSATVVIGYDAWTAANLNTKRMRVYWLDESANVWKVIGTSKADPANTQVTAEVPHFTKFRAMVYGVGGPLVSEEEIYTVPNPARGDSLLFKLRLTDAADVTIKIYNVAGEQVEEFTRSYGAEDAGLPRAIPWDIRSVASGVYLYRVEAVGTTRTDAVTKKLAVIK